MKKKTLKIIIAVFVGIVAFSALPNTAQAGHAGNRRIHHTCGHCHSPVYSYRTLSYYDSHGHPFYNWVIRGHSHGHRGHGFSYGYGHGFAGHGFRHGFTRRFPSHRIHHGHHRSRTGFSFSFGHH
ncbi:MAG: hypothetical protein L3J39_16470 [Verrucomicrobiales bacterium]|nr:hypothetical protein [Verrucomicrobiales bacterium]